jgi:transcriptional regulator with XRE-family HTH domain
LLGCSHQAISRTERFDSNPPLEFVNAWRAALGLGLQTEATNLLGHERE